MTLKGRYKSRLLRWIMTTSALIVIFVLLACFAGVLLVGAPYVPTLGSTQKTALSMLGLRPGQHMLELGCGDGRVLVAAAKMGIRATGYELNPLLWLVATVLTWRYRRFVRVRLGSFWSAQWPEADGIYVFLQDRFMEKLHNKIVQQYAGKNINVVSYAFKIPGQKVVKEYKALYLYVYKAS